MNWYNKLVSNEENGSANYQNAINEIRSQFNQHPEKLNEFAVFKEELVNNSYILYFSPTNDSKFLSILKNHLKAKPCEKPNLNNAKLFLGRYI